MSIIAWIVVGLVAGLIARALMPGNDSMGIGATILLGIVGSIVGGFIADAVTSGDQQFSPAGWIGSILGAMLVLFVVRMVAGGRRHTV